MTLENDSLSTSSIEARVTTIMKAFSRPWRWFQLSSNRVILEPPYGVIDPATMSYLDNLPDIHSVEAVFRTTPHPGIYLQFTLHKVS